MYKIVHYLCMHYAGAISNSPFFLNTKLGTSKRNSYVLYSMYFVNRWKYLYCRSGWKVMGLMLDPNYVIAKDVKSCAYYC